MTAAKKAKAAGCKHISCQGYATCRRVPSGEPTDVELAAAPDLTKAGEQLALFPLTELDSQAAPTIGVQPAGTATLTPISTHPVGNSPNVVVTPIVFATSASVTVERDAASTFAPAPLPAPGARTVEVDPLAQSLAEALADGIWQGDATAHRSMQVAIGFSQIGGDCDRRLTHHLRGTRPVNFPDPLRAVVGTGVHLILADYWRRLDGGTGRYLVEQRLSWQGVPGTVDLFDRRRRVVIDWKTTTLDKIARYRTQGPTRTQVIQIMGYGAALQAAGENVESVALAFVPTDGELTDLFVWRAPLDVTIAQRAVDRLANLAQSTTPTTAVPATPGALCRWCPFHRPGSTDLTIACPGKDQTS